MVHVNVDERLDFFFPYAFLFLLVQPVNFLSRSLNLSSSSRKNDSGLLNRAFVQVQPEKMSYRKMPSHFRPPAPVSSAATALPGRSLSGTLLLSFEE